MGNQIAFTAIFLTGIILLLFFNEMVYRRLKLKGEVTRKFAHFTATLSTASFPFLFTHHLYVLVLAVIFFALLLSSRKTSYLNSINDIDRKSIGSFLLPVSIYLTFLIYYFIGDKLFFILPILILAISDPAAGIIGLNLNPDNNYSIRIFSKTLDKTWPGSFTFLVSSFFISVLVLYTYRGYFDIKALGLAAAVAFVSTITEMLSWKGTDNLFIPLSIIIVLMIAL